MPVGNPVTDLSTSGNFVPVTRTLTINGVSYDLSADRSWSIASPGGGSVTSVAMTVPTGFAVAGSPITTAGTLAVSFASGYALPTTVKQSNWDDAYTFVSNFPSQTGNNGKFLYTSGSVLSWQPALQNPMTAIGDMIYGGVSGAVTVLPGNQFTTRAYLQQVGTGSASAAPTWGGIISTDITGQALTSTNDTNVQITLGGTPGNSVLNAVSLTMGWAGQLSAGRGGTGTSGVTGIMLGNATAPVTGVTGIGGQILRANPSTGAYEFWTPTYLESPMTQLGQIIYGGAGGQPLALNANSTANNMFLRSVSSGVPGWATIAGSDITGAALTRTNDTNVQITLGGSATTGLLRAISLTMGWAGQLSVPRGGTGASTLTGVVIGNSTGAMTAVAGTANQLLRRNAGDTAYEFFTPTFLSNPMTTLGDIIYGGAAGQPLRLGANTSGLNQYLRSVSSGAPSWASIAGGDVTGAAITTANDTNILITASGNTTNALLRTMTLTAGWTGNLSVARGGSGAGTLTGILVGNGTSAFTGITGTSNQMLRRNGANTAYEFFTPSFPTGSGTTNFVTKWTSSSTIGDSIIRDNGTNVGIGINPSHKLDVNGNIGISGKIILLASGVNHVIYDQSANSAIIVGDSSTGLTTYNQTTHTFRNRAGTTTYASLTASGVNIGTGHLQLPTTSYITWGGAYGTDIPTISGTSGSGLNGFLQFYPAGSTSGVKMALRRTGQLALPSYTSSSAFTGTSVATLAVTNAGDVITIAPQQTTASGTYTPTWTGLANVGSVTAFSCQYMRVGDTVTVSGWVTIDAVSDNTPTSLSFSLPINSNTSTVNYLNGTGVAQGGGPAASISGYGANTGEFEVVPAVATAVNYSFHFTYRIV